MSSLSILLVVLEVLPFLEIDWLEDNLPPFRLLDDLGKSVDIPILFNRVLLAFVPLAIGILN